MSRLYLLILSWLTLCTALPSVLNTSQILQFPIYNTSLAHIHEPTGPPEFAVEVLQGTTTLSRLTTSLSVVRYMAIQAQEEWNSFMPTARGVYRDPLNPRLAIAFASALSAPMPRPYVMWGLATFMNIMIRIGPFRASQARLRWAGVVVGTIRFIDTGTGAYLQDFGDVNGADLEIPSNTTTTASIGDEDDLTFEYDYRTEEPAIDKVMLYMSTIAALVQAAQIQVQAVPHFVGSWPENIYNVLHVWYAAQTPSTLSKKWLVQGILAAVNNAASRRIVHTLSIAAKQHGVLVATGAFTKIPSPFEVSGSNLTATN